MASDLGYAHLPVKGYLFDPIEPANGLIQRFAHASYHPFYASYSAGLEFPSLALTSNHSTLTQVPNP